MRYYTEKHLKDFEFWSGAKSTAQLLTMEEMDRLEEYFDEISHEWNWSETEVNDFFWFETDWIAQFLGYDDFEEMFKERYNKQMELRKRLNDKMENVK